MDSLPDEILFTIFNYCDFPTLMRIRKVDNRRCKIVNYVMYYKKKIVVDFENFSNNHDDKEDIVTYEMTGFIRFLKRYSHSLREIVIGLIPIRITMAGLIQLASVLPRLESLDFNQTNDLPIIEKDALYALPYFKKLKHLRLKGWNTVENNRRGCAYRKDMLPFRGLIPLQSLVIDSKKDTVANILSEMQRNLILLSNLKRVKLYVHLSNVDLPSLLSWFFQSHSNLEIVHVSGVLFSSELQVHRFYRSILSLPNLQKISLENCKAIAALDQSLATTYLKEAYRLHIGVEGTVSSLRFLPEGTP